MGHRGLEPRSASRSQSHGPETGPDIDKDFCLCHICFCDKETVIGKLSFSTKVTELNGFPGITGQCLKISCIVTSAGLVYGHQVSSEQTHGQVYFLLVSDTRSLVAQACLEFAE